MNGGLHNKIAHEFTDILIRTRIYITDKEKYTVSGIKESPENWIDFEERIIYSSSNSKNLDIKGYTILKMDKSSKLGRMTASRKNKIMV